MPRNLRNKFDDFFSCLVQYANMTDRQTDGRTAGNSKDHAYA